MWWFKLITITCLILCISINTIRTSSSSTENNPVAISELVEQLRIAILTKDVIAVKMYLDELEALGESFDLISSNNKNTNININNEDEKEKVNNFINDEVNSIVTQKKDSVAIEEANVKVEDMERKGNDLQRQVNGLFGELSFSWGEDEKKEQERRIQELLIKREKEKEKPSSKKKKSQKNSYDLDWTDLSPDFMTTSSYSSSKKKLSKNEMQRLQDKREILRLRKIVEEARKHQAQEVAKLKAVKQGVEALVKSLNGTKSNLMQAKKESSEMETELQILHTQAEAATELEKEIAEIQEHAKINYETGEVELTNIKNKFSVGEVAAKVNAGGKHRDVSALTPHLADPAVLHADLRLLLDIVILLGAAAIGGMCAALLRLPPIIGYIAGGTIVGPSGWNLVHTVVQVETLAQFGSVFFLFAHGLEYSYKEQRQFQTVSFGGSLLATALISVFIQLYTLWVGIVQSPLEGALLGLSASLSSLSVVLDYLHEQKLLQSTHGKVMVGMLAFEGLLMGLFFSIPPALAGGSISVGGVGLALTRAILGVIFVVLFATMFLKRLIMPYLLNFLLSTKTNSSELFLLGIVSMAMMLALLTEFLGLSLDLGAFLAGLMIAGTPFMEKTTTSIQPLASLFASMLFASLGMIINIQFFVNNLFSIIVIVVQIFVVKLIVITCVVRLFSYSWRTSISSGVGLAHIGEFSLLFSSKLQAHGLLSRRAYLLFLAATVTTLVVAPLILRILILIMPFIDDLFASKNNNHRNVIDDSEDPENTTSLNVDDNSLLSEQHDQQKQNQPHENSKIRLMPHTLRQPRNQFNKAF